MKKDDLEVEELVRMMRELLPHLAHFNNYEVRQRTLKRIMKRRLGRHWEFVLYEQGKPCGSLPGCCESTMLEKLDRAGKLKGDLTEETVQDFARREIDLYRKGELAGNMWLSNNPPPIPLPRDFVYEICSVEMIGQVLELFSCEADYKANGEAWLRGFISSVQSANFRSADGDGSEQRQ